MEEVVETVITITEIADLLNSIFDSDGDGNIIPQELTDVLDTFSDGELGNNDVEVLLNDINNNLLTIDERLNSEFVAVNDCLGFIATCLIAAISWKFLTWIYSMFSR